MIGHKVPEDDAHWLHYVELLEVVDLLFSPIVRPDTPGYIELLLQQNLQAFTSLYHEHFLIHMPRYMAK